jgi:Ca2+-binding EF-hand superfamily protein
MSGIYRDKLTREMIEEVEETFESLTTPGQRDAISKEKLELGLRALGMQYYWTDVKSAVKVGEDSRVDIELFIQIVSECIEQRSTWGYEEMIEAYHVYDATYNGYLEAKEIRHVLHMLGEQVENAAIEDQLREYDIDGDAQMVIPEFTKMISQTFGSDFVYDERR